MPYSNTEYGKQLKALANLRNRLSIKVRRLESDPDCTAEELNCAKSQLAEAKEKSIQHKMTKKKQKKPSRPKTKNKSHNSQSVMTTVSSNHSQNISQTSTAQQKRSTLFSKKSISTYAPDGALQYTQQIVEVQEKQSEKHSLAVSHSVQEALESLKDQAQRSASPSENSKLVKITENLRTKKYDRVLDGCSVGLTVLDHRKWLQEFLRSDTAWRRIKNKLQERYITPEDRNMLSRYRGFREIYQNQLLSVNQAPIFKEAVELFFQFAFLQLSFDLLSELHKFVRKNYPESSVHLIFDQTFTSIIREARIALIFQYASTCQRSGVCGSLLGLQNHLAFIVKVFFENCSSSSAFYLKSRPFVLRRLFNGENLMRANSKMIESLKIVNDFIHASNVAQLVAPFAQVMVSYKLSLGMWNCDFDGPIELGPLKSVPLGELQLGLYTHGEDHDFLVRVESECDLFDLSYVTFVGFKIVLEHELACWAYLNSKLPQKFALNRSMQLGLHLCGSDIQMLASYDSSAQYGGSDKAKRKYYLEKSQIANNLPGINELIKNVRNQST